MYTLRRVFAFLVTLLVLSSGAGRAQAQSTLKINKAGVVHSIARTNNRTVYLLNRADCESNDIISFPISLTNRGTDALQAWVGTSACTDASLRQNATQTQCWKVADIAPAGGTNANTPTLDISVRAMLAGYTCGAGTTTNTGDSTAGSGGTAGTGGDGVATSGGGATSAGGATSTASCIQPINSLVDPGPEACVQSTTVAGSTTLTVYIMLVNPSTLAADASDTWVGTFKLVGPPPPDNFSVGIGGNLLVTKFSYSSPPSDQTGNGFTLFCDPPPGAASAVDAGLLEADAGMGTQYSCGGVPVSQVLIPNQLPPSKNSIYRCGGTTSGSSQSANATNLVDGVAYNVGVAAFDTYDNTGPLSAVKCEVPQPVTGFFKAYQDAGGKAGGGFCSFSRHGEPLTLIAVLGFASFLVFRRRRAA